ncbi:MAG: hypothetical protein JSW61_12380 [Candidatus Thorarchaeota archaeon]|nr:MAG: hypothetical protein JSW61_12380 [Candidatus Thorarchaeota archaeon]
MKVESVLIVTLRDILCGTLSLDDGLSTIQRMSIKRSDESDIVFECARAIEEIILRRPSIASAKLTELVVRLSFEENRVLPEMLALLDTRYTSDYRRIESELLPDLAAVQVLLDILGELSLSVDMALELNLRPVLPFFADEVLMTLNAIVDKRHEAATRLALREVHHLTARLTEASFFEGAELLLNRMMVITKDLSIDDLHFDVSLDESSVLTELGIYDQARVILKRLETEATQRNSSVDLAAITLALSINETRDDSVDHVRARTLGDYAAEMFRQVLDEGESSKDGLGLAHLVIGSSILANGWRESVPEAITRLNAALEVFESKTDLDVSQSLLLFRTLSGIGFAHGLLDDDRSITRSIEYMTRAKSALERIEQSGFDIRCQMARVENAIGWVCLSNDSTEFWSIGIEAFQNAIRIREDLLQTGHISELEALGSHIGLVLSMMRSFESTDDEMYETLREVLVSYFPLFPSDPRAFVEAAISMYNVVWLTIRHGKTLPEKILRLLEDMDRMLSDARDHEESIFIQGVSLVVPYLNKQWPTLRDRAAKVVSEDSVLADAARLMIALASGKMNLQAISLEARVRSLSPVEELVELTDNLLAQYWHGQNAIAKTLKAYYDNRDYSEVATGLYQAANILIEVGAVETEYVESSEFIRATAISFSETLMRFALALEGQFGAQIDRIDSEKAVSSLGDEEINLILTEDWLGLMKITDNYLEMVEEAELAQAQPYLNAVFSNITRALRMMDSVSLVDRRVLSFLGDIMNRKYYLRV